MRLKRAVDAVDETLPDSGRVAQILPNVAERKRRLKEQVHICDVDGQIASECPRMHRPLVQINGDLFPVYVDRVALVTRKASSAATMMVAFSFTVISSLCDGPAGGSDPTAGRVRRAG